MIKLLSIIITSFSISGVLFAMETQPTNKQELITLMASDATTIQVPKQAIKPILEHLKGKPSTSDDDRTTIPADFVNAKGLTYLKEYLETPDDKKHTVVQKLISTESVETIYGLYKFLDCWELLQKNSWSKIEEQLRPLRNIKEVIFCGPVAYAITFIGGCFIKIDVQKGTLETLFTLKVNRNNLMLALATNSQRNVFYFGDSDSTLHIFNSDLQTFDHVPQKSGMICDILVSPDDSFILVANDFRINIYGKSLHKKKELHRDAIKTILITSDSKHIVSIGSTWGKYTLYIADKNGNIIKEIAEDTNFRHNFLAFANKDCAHIVVCSNNNTTIYDLQLNKLAELKPNIYEITYLQANDNIIVIGDEKGSIHLWQFNPSTNSVTHINSIKHHCNKIKNIVFSPNGKHIACAGADQKVILVDCKGNLVDSWRLHSDKGKMTLAFSNDGEQIIISSVFETIMRSVPPIANLTEFNQLPSLLQKKIIYELNDLGTISNDQTRSARLKSLCNDLEMIGFEIPEIKKYLREQADNIKL